MDATRRGFLAGAALLVGPRSLKAAPGEMPKRKLGKTGLEPTLLGFGCMTTTDASVIEQAADAGINWFDTARGYQNGNNERMVGAALKSRRQKLHITTKTPARNKADALAHLDTSLRELQTDHVDVLQYHGGYYTDADVERFLRPGGVIDGLKALKRDGLTRFIGFTSEGANGATSRFIATGEFDVMQICYNLIFQHPYDPSRKAGAIYEAEAQRMGIVTMRPLTSGIFQHWIRLLDPTLEQRVDLPRALLGFVLSNPLVDVAIVGMRSPSRVEANVAIADDPAARIDLEAMHERYVRD